MPPRNPSRLLVLTLRLRAVRRAAIRLSDLDIARAKLDSALHANAVEGLARRTEAEAASRQSAGSTAPQHS